jgi:exosortase A-associated hydrolase 1
LSSEAPVVFRCAGESLVGILHRPVRPRDLGVVVVVGGPQYRVGSHRQFTLLARSLAEQGFAVLRFDCRGMGDSGGEFPGFESISPDIAAAIDCLLREVPELRSIALWGLCDAASAVLMHTATDPRVDALVLLNPWARTETTLARTYLRHYYTARLLDREFWSKMFGGNLRLGQVLRDLADNVRSGSRQQTAPRGFLERMRDALTGFPGPVLIVLSGNDITAAEFARLAETPGWKPLLQRPGITRHDMPDANHTFSTRAWRSEVAALTADFLRAVRGVPDAADRT